MTFKKTFESYFKKTFEFSSKKTFESPFTITFVGRFSDESLLAVSSPEAKLAGFPKLRAGWYNGRGELISDTALRIARKLLRAAHGGNIDATDVFPRPDGGVTLAVYYSNRDLAFNIKPTGLLDVDSETEPNFPLLKGLSEAHAFFIIDGIRQWNWSFSYTSPNMMRTSTGFEALVSRDPGTVQAFPFSRGSALRKRQAPYVLMRGLSIPA
jgi:hypothetical protein